MTARLYQLDWDSSRKADRDRHFDLISGLRTEHDQASLYLEAFAEGLYVHVADFDGGDLEQLWTATNNGVLSDSWSLMPPEGVIPVEPVGVHGDDGRTYGRRSTSVGDIAEIGGRLHVVATVGWHEIGPVPEAGLKP